MRDFITYIDLIKISIQRMGVGAGRGARRAPGAGAPGASAKKCTRTVAHTLSLTQDVLYGALFSINIYILIKRTPRRFFLYHASSLSQSLAARCSRVWLALVKVESGTTHLKPF